MGKNKKSTRENESITNLLEFTYLDYKIELDKLLTGNVPHEKLVEDKMDFWNFVRKYETVLKKRGKPILCDPLDCKKSEYKKFNVYNQSMCNFLIIDWNTKEESKFLMNFGEKSSSLSKYKLRQFHEIILAYLDFNQKEKFAKLRKLRQSQKSLPIYKHKKEILDGIENNQIVIIAGDTGCGKSTQIPQYLHQIGYKNVETEKGDVLIFVSGVNEITSVIDAANEYADTHKNWIILPLHSGLSLSDQDKVFDYAPEAMRKCIVSTNIAETSVTVDGVRFVIDSGKMKEMNYDSSCKMQKLIEFWVSKSSAEQRRGRAGRTGPGICYRLYSEKDFNSFEPYPTPEIQRVPLESILLQMVSMGLPNVRIFPFIESPRQETIERAIFALKQHNALTAEEKITPLGKALSMLPVDISIGKMLLMGCVFQELPRVLTLSSCLSIQSPFTSRAFADLTCEQNRKGLISDHGDAFTLLNSYKEWLEQKWTKNENTKKWCRKMGFEEQRFYELTKLRNQFKNILETSKLLEEQQNQNLSSAERSIRYGEIKTLKAIRKAHKMEAPKRRKIIQFENEEKGEEAYDNRDDIRDVDFRLTHDSNKLKDLLYSATVSTHKSVLLLKLIMVSGLYPQIAIPDEFNYCKSGNQQFFHTFSKPFVSIHPNCNFASNLALLKLFDSDILEKPNYYVSKLPLSSAHQILCYQNLLETAKPYLLNIIRMPAAQTLLLFSFAIDTNSNVTKVVCDSWLCLEFPILQTGQDLMLRAIQIREKWQNLLSKKLNEEQENIKSEDDGDDEFDQEQLDLCSELINFMNVNVCYTLKRLLPADLKDIYTNFISNENFETNPFLAKYKITENQIKGGYNVSDNVVYACLKETSWSIAMAESMKEVHWTCTNCNEEISVEGISKILHQNDCKKIEIKLERPDDKGKSKNLKLFSCNNCKRSMYLTHINILKHKEQCKRSQYKE